MRELAASDSSAPIALPGFVLVYMNIVLNHWVMIFRMIRTRIFKDVRFLGLEMDVRWPP
ncbi:hypothetical protein PSEUDO8Z_100052 [Pseudomonas sp. 8Z]|nr:hypothetical protein PSEUDO8Z_100052 [Pseudomonas sp. 8Z]